MSQSFVFPKGSCNSHAHAIGPRERFPLDPQRPFDHADAPIEELFEWQDQYGLERLVLIQSLAHGNDHAATIAAIALRPDTTRGVAFAAKNATAKQFSNLAQQGFVAARVHLPTRLPYHLTPDEMERVAYAAADVGWHIEVHCHGEQLEQILPRLSQLPCSVVIDHMAYPNPTLHPSVLEAVELPNVFVKISAPNRVDNRDYEIGAASVRTLITRAPEKLIWGTDWPHVGEKNVDNDALVALLESYSTDAMQTILIDTPNRLYFQ